jgi:hypothetical protein
VRWHIGERFNQFVALHQKAVWDEVLKSVRDGMGDPNWRRFGF